MKASEVREKSESELKSLAQDLARQLWQAQFDNQTNKLDDSSKIGQLRRDIARVNTVLTEKASAAPKATAAKKKKA